MRFRAKDGQSARRFVFDRTPPPNWITPMGAITARPTAGKSF